MSTIVQQDPFAEPCSPLDAIQHLIAQDPDIKQVDKLQLLHAKQADIWEEMQKLSDFMARLSDIITRLGAHLDNLAVQAYMIEQDIPPLHQNLHEEFGPSYSVEEAQKFFKKYFRGQTAESNSSK